MVDAPVRVGLRFTVVFTSYHASHNKGLHGLGTCPSSLFFDKLESRASSGRSAYWVGVGVRHEIFLAHRKPCEGSFCNTRRVLRPMGGLPDGKEVAPGPKKHRTSQEAHRASFPYK